MRPRRSALYMPGSNPRALEKAKSLDADALILDLEDAVAPDAKDIARAQVCAAVASGGFGFREVIIRINGLCTPFGLADLQKAAVSKPDGILIPKVETASDLNDVRAVCARENAPVLPLWAMIETPLAILNLKEIAQAAASEAYPLTCFVLGTNDLMKATRALPDDGRASLLSWLSLTVATARAFNISILDGVYNNLEDEDGFIVECTQGRRLGMDGKTLIHPKQIGICNAAFSPSAGEIATAQKIAAAFDLPENRGKGAINLDGSMVELLHGDIAREILAFAAAIEKRGDAQQ